MDEFSLEWKTLKQFLQKMVILQSVLKELYIKH